MIHLTVTDGRTFSVDFDAKGFREHLRATRDKDEWVPAYDPHRGVAVAVAPSAIIYWRHE